MTAQKPRAPHTHPARSAHARPWLARTLVAVAALCGLGLGLFYYALPGLLTDKVTAGLIQRAEKRGIKLTIGKTWFEPLSALTLDNVEVRDAAHPEAVPIARIARLQVKYEIGGLFSPKLYLQTILLQAPDLYVRREANGTWNAQSLIDRLLKPREDDEEARGGGWRKYVSKHLPDIEMRQLRAAFDDEHSQTPAKLAGLDLHHLRISDAALSLKNTSAVAETQNIVLQASARVAGMADAVQLTGKLDRPSDGKELGTGEVTLRLPGEMAVDMGGWRAQVGQLTARTDGSIALGRVQLAQTTGSSQFALDIQEIAIKLSATPGPEPVLPEALQAKIPPFARQLLRRVAEVAIEEPVIVGKRQEKPKEAATADDDDDETAEEVALDAAKQPAKGGKNAKAEKAAKAAKDAKDAAAAAKKIPDGPEGAAIRNGLSAAFTQGADKLEHSLAKLKMAVAAIPVPLITVQRGRARFSDEQGAAGGQARELSDFSAKLQRKPGEDVARLELAFHTPGRQETNQIESRVDTKTGDVELKIQLEHLPLAAYAAVLPPSVVPQANGAIRDAAVTLLYTAATGQLTLEGHGKVEHMDADIARISRQRLEDLVVEAHGKLAFDLRKEELKLDDAEMVVGKTHAVIQATMKRFRTAPAFAISLKIPTVPCQDVVDSLPRGFAPMLEGMTCEGQMSAEAKLALDTGNMNSLKLEWEPALANVRVTSMGKYIRFDIFDAAFEHHARQKDGTLYTFVTGPGADLWAPLESISPNFVKVLTTTEDGGFFGHHGFSWESFKNAAIENLKRGRFVRGASTITQQLVKNLFFVEREKTISRKVQEAVVTWQIERSLSKQQLLALYLNIIELGPKIYGIKAAAQHYFNRAPGELTLLQTIWLGDIVPNPRAFYHQYRDGKVSDSTKTTLCWIADVMVKRGKIAEEERRMLGDCGGVFAPEAAPVPDRGLGHEGDPEIGVPPPAPPIVGEHRQPAPPPPPPILEHRQPSAPSVAPNEQP